MDFMMGCDYNLNSNNPSTLVYLFWVVLYGKAGCSPILNKDHWDDWRIENPFVIQISSYKMDIQYVYIQRMFGFLRFMQNKSMYIKT